MLRPRLLVLRLSNRSRNRRNLVGFLRRMGPVVTEIIASFSTEVCLKVFGSLVHFTVVEGADGPARSKNNMNGAQAKVESTGRATDGNASKPKAETKQTPKPKMKDVVKAIPSFPYFIKSQQSFRHDGRKMRLFVVSLLHEDCSFALELLSQTDGNNGASLLREISSAWTGFSLEAEGKAVSFQRTVLGVLHFLDRTRFSTNLHSINIIVACLLTGLCFSSSGFTSMCFKNGATFSYRARFFLPRFEFDQIDD